MPTYRADINPVEAAETARKRKRRTIALIVLALLSALVALAYFQTRHYLLKDLPSLPDKRTMWELNLQPNMTLLDKDGNQIGHRGPHIGRPMKLGQMPSYVGDAFLAIEDERFYEHAGIDNKAILRALFENTRAGQKTQGGSTLTQQLVKNIVLSPEKSYRRKFQEAVLARDMEAVLSKPEILELYINRISWTNPAKAKRSVTALWFPSITEMEPSSPSSAGGIMARLNSIARTKPNVSPAPASRPSYMQPRLKTASHPALCGLINLRKSEIGPLRITRVAIVDR